MAMTIEMAHRARSERCVGCTWFKQSITVSGVQEYGHCLQGPPRATSNAAWPVVRADMWCGAWMPRAELLN